jgi:hypothetical protein
MRKSFDEAFDERGILKDGRSTRVSMRFRDSLSPLQKAVAADTAARTNKITDGRGGDANSLHRPGFRVSAGDARQKVADAYARYETELCNRYKANDSETLCPRCSGEGTINGETCEKCDGEGAISDDDEQEDNGGSGYGSTNEGGFDSRTVDRRSAEYDAYDNQIRDAWRGSK